MQWYNQMDKVKLFIKKIEKNIVFISEPKVVFFMIVLHDEIAAFAFYPSVEM